jgi:hypothetical protein
MPHGSPQNSEQNALRQFVDAVHALSDEPTKANVERYLAESSALEHHRRSARTPRERPTHALPLLQSRS